MAWVEERGPWYRVRWRDADGGVHTTPDKYRTKKQALAGAEEMDTDQRRGLFIDPAAGRTPLAEWAATWRQVHRVAPSTKAKYDHYLDRHMLPAFGQVSLDGIARLTVKQWAGQLSDRYAPATVSGIITLLSVVLTAAVDERMLAINPIQGLRLNTSPHLHAGPGQAGGGRSRRVRPVPTGRQVLQIADRIGRSAGPNAAAMAITAAFTGMRWGELAGLAAHKCHTGNGYLLVEPDRGALHEVGGNLWLGPPKSQAAARRIDLPPFLADLLDQLIADRDGELVFVAADGGMLRRSNFARRIWRPACDGTPGLGEGGRSVPPILSGAVFHGLRHHHKTMLDELDVP
jgi:integrase